MFITIYEVRVDQLVWKYWVLCVLLNNTYITHIHAHHNTRYMAFASHIPISKHDHLWYSCDAINAMEWMVHTRQTGVGCLKVNIDNKIPWAIWRDGRILFNINMVGYFQLHKLNNESDYYCKTIITIKHYKMNYICYFCETDKYM